MTDQEYYQKREIKKDQHNYAVLKAKNRGDISDEWHKNHTLTPQTMAEFKALMKKADKDFDKLMEKEK